MFSNKSYSNPVYANSQQSLNASQISEPAFTYHNDQRNNHHSREQLNDAMYQESGAVSLYQNTNESRDTADCVYSVVEHRPEDYVQMIENDIYTGGGELNPPDTVEYSRVKKKRKDNVVMVDNDLYNS